jgi:hypothetical protein
LLGAGCCGTMLGAEAEPLAAKGWFIGLVCQKPQMPETCITPLSVNSRRRGT